MKKDLLERVIRVFENRRSCQECPHYCERSEGRPYGDSIAYESLESCDLLDTIGRLQECPGLEENEDE